MGLFDKLFGKKGAPKSLTLKEYNKSHKSNPPGPDVAYIEWSCLNDERSCPGCKAKDGMKYLPSKIKEVGLPPLQACCCEGGCRCIGVYVNKSEMGAKETVKLIRKKGGIIEV